MSVDIAQYRKDMEKLGDNAYFTLYAGEMRVILDELEALREKSTDVDDFLDAMPNTQPKAIYPVKVRVQGVDNPPYRSSLEDEIPFSDMDYDDSKAQSEWTRDYD